MMPLMTAAGWAAQLHSCTTVGLPAVALPNFRHSAAQRQNGTLHNGTTVHIPKAHPGRAGGTQQQQQHAVGAEPAPGADTHVSSLPLANFKINKGGEAEAGKWKKKVKVEREHAETNGEFPQCFFGQILPKSWLSIRKQQTSMLAGGSFLQLVVQIFSVTNSEGNLSL